MKPVFADTMFYVALHNRRDQYHAKAVEYSERTHIGVVTTEYVLIEEANFFKRPGDRGKFIQFEKRLRLDDTVTLVDSSPGLFQNGLSLFAQRGDKEWSLVDCISMQLMAELGLTDVLTADEHFRQAGFNALLLTDSAQ